ncbi:MAG: hypothetical protein JXM73_04105 [Anaerolineae bacterium]|nr:hypothetical protein [Anaerolineae bacterium]
MRFRNCAALLLLLWVLAGCDAALTPGPASGDDGALESAVTPGLQASPAVYNTALDDGSVTGSTGKGEPISLTLAPKGIKLEPQPLRAGFPFTITVPIHNNNPAPAIGVPVMIYLSAKQEQIGFGPFFQVVTVTVPATQTLAVEVPVAGNLAGGEYRLWVQVNRLSAPVAQQAGAPTLPETGIDDNAALLDVVVEPFDAYVSDLCPGRMDVAVGFAEMWIESDLQHIHMWVHNLGNQAVYNLPVLVLGEQVVGVAYTPAIPPCGGTAEVVVGLDRPLEAGDSVDVAVNPKDWPDGLAEDSFDNNYVRSVTISPGGVLSESGETAVQPGILHGGGSDYDFAVSPADVEIVRPGIVLVKVYNLGTRDVANVPIWIEGKAGRKVIDVVPLIKGNGLGVAAIQLGWVWYPKATLTLTVNPEGAKGAYPETDRDNNVVIFALP